MPSGASRISGTRCPWRSMASSNVGRRQQHRDHRLQSLAADPVGRLPKHDKRLANHPIVKPTALVGRHGPVPVDQPAVVALGACGDGPSWHASSSRIWVFSPRSLPQYRTAKATSNSSRVVMLTRLIAPHRRARIGSKSDEATTPQPGPFQARQCALQKPT